MEKYQVIIKDLETGETLVDVGTNAIIGAIDEGEDEDGGIRCVCLTSCSTLELAATITGALQIAATKLVDLPAWLAKPAKQIVKEEVKNHKKQIKKGDLKL